MAPIAPTPAELTAALIGFDTVSHRSNLPAVDFVAAYLAGHGIDSLIVPNETGDKAALFATIGPKIDGGVCLSGHLDVVPVAGQAWTSPPFEARIADGRLIGRGACDMKGFIGTVLALVPAMVSARLTRPIHILLSYDEEVSCLGSLDVIRRFGRDLPKPRAAIIGEPTMMQVVDAHKSITCLETIITGRPAHAALPDLGANAIHAAAPIIALIDALAGELRARGDPSGRFTPACSTTQIGRIDGGEAINIVPGSVRLIWEIRGLPTLDPDEIVARVDALAREVVEPRLRVSAPEAGVVTRRTVYVPALAPEPGSPAESLALRLAGQNQTHAVSYGTEAGHFQIAGVPAIVCGPGSIEHAHRADEHVDLAQLDACAAFLRGLIATLSG